MKKHYVEAFTAIVLLPLLIGLFVFLPLVGLVFLILIGLGIVVIGSKRRR